MATKKFTITYAEKMVIKSLRKGGKIDLFGSTRPDGFALLSHDGCRSVMGRGVLRLATENGLIDNEMKLTALGNSTDLD